MKVLEMSTSDVLGAALYLIPDLTVEQMQSERVCVLQEDTVQIL